MKFRILVLTALLAAGAAQADGAPEPVRIDNVAKFLDQQRDIRDEPAHAQSLTGKMDIERMTDEAASTVGSDEIPRSDALFTVKSAGAAAMMSTSAEPTSPASDRAIASVVSA